MLLAAFHCVHVAAASQNDCHGPSSLAEPRGFQDVCSRGLRVHPERPSGLSSSLAPMTRQLIISMAVTAALAAAAPAGASTRKYGMPCGAGICPVTTSAITSAKAWSRWITRQRILNGTGVDVNDSGTVRCRHLGGGLRYRCKVHYSQGENVTWDATSTVRLPRLRSCSGRFDIRATRLSPAARDPAVSHSHWRGHWDECEI